MYLVRLLVIIDHVAANSRMKYTDDVDHILTRHRDVYSCVIRAVIVQ